MSLLDRVRWPAVYRDHHDRADPRTRTHAAAAGGITDAFAILVAGEHYTVLRAIIAAHSPLDLDDAERVGRWLESTAHVIVGQLAERTHPAPKPPVPRDGQLHVDDELAGLPLLHPLLATFAHHVGGFRVIACPLPLNVGGRYSFRLIELDSASAGTNLHTVWHHELGHAFDPWHRPTSEEREDYADELGGLLRHHQPATLDELGELALAAHETVTGHPRHQPQSERADTDLPAPGPASIQAFRSLPLDDQQAAA